jgi:hypothetical protein
MNTELLNLISAVFITVIYLVLAMKTIMPIFKSISNPMSSATGVLFYGSLLGFGLTLNNFSSVATGALHYYAGSGNIMKGFLYWFLFAAIAFIFSYIVFRLSFAMVGLATAENEKAELAKNNFTIAGIHIVVYNMTCLIVSQPLVDLANTMIKYPQFPN